MFTKLPNELILMTVERLPTLSDISALMRTSHRHYALLTPFLLGRIPRREGDYLELQRIFLWACENGNEMVLEAALDYGANCEQGRLVKRPLYGSDGYFSPLALAAYGGHEAIIKRLIECVPDIVSEDANLNENDWHYPALDWAVIGGQTKTFKMMLEQAEIMVWNDMAYLGPGISWFPVPDLNYYMELAVEFERAGIESYLQERLKESVFSKDDKR